MQNDNVVSSAEKGRESSGLNGRSVLSELQQMHRAQLIQAEVAKAPANGEAILMHFRCILAARHHPAPRNCLILMRVAGNRMCGRRFIGQAGLTIGSTDGRCRPKRASALATAGPMVGKPASPTPVGFWSEAIIVTSTAGISFMRSTR